MSGIPAHPEEVQLRAVLFPPPAPPPVAAVQSAGGFTNPLIAAMSMLRQASAEIGAENAQP
eukprot:2831898-Pyramimonas_sp.AAC.1